MSCLRFTPNGWAERARMGDSGRPHPPCRHRGGASLDNNGTAGLCVFTVVESSPRACFSLPTPHDSAGRPHTPSPEGCDAELTAPMPRRAVLQRTAAEASATAARPTTSPVSPPYPGRRYGLLRPTADVPGLASRWGFLAEHRDKERDRALEEQFRRLRAVSQRAIPLRSGPASSGSVPRQSLRSSSSRTLSSYASTKATSSSLPRRSTPRCRACASAVHRVPDAGGRRRRQSASAEGAQRGAAVGANGPQLLASARFE